MGTLTTVCVLFTLQVLAVVVGEPSNYRTYRVLNNGSPYYTYYNPYSTRYADYYPSDNKVYVTDQYGRTTAQTGLRYAETRYAGQQYSGAQYSTALGSSTYCTGTTCGQNAQCSVIGGRPVCSCLKGHTGDPLSYCRRAECLSNSECRGNLVCVNEKCVDPCAGACGANAYCEARNHIPVCSCPAGYTGDPFTSCRRFDPGH